MTEQEIYLEQYDWAAHMMYDVRPKDGSYARRCLRELGCKGVPLEDATNIVLSGDANKGFTYSNVSKRKSVVGIGWNTSDDEMINSLSHEMLHVVQHIAGRCMIDMYGEEACYLMGSLMQATGKRRGDKL